MLLDETEMLEDLKAMNKLHSVTSEVNVNEILLNNMFSCFLHLLNLLCGCSVFLSQKNGSKVNKSSNNSNQSTSHSKKQRCL